MVEEGREDVFVGVLRVGAERGLEVLRYIGESLGEEELMRFSLDRGWLVGEWRGGGGC